MSAIKLALVLKTQHSVVMKLKKIVDYTVTNGKTFFWQDEKMKWQIKRN